MLKHAKQIGFIIHILIPHGFMIKEKISYDKYNYANFNLFVLS